MRGCAPAAAPRAPTGERAMVMLDASDAPTQAQVSASDAAASSGCVLRTTPGAKRLHASPATAGQAAIASLPFT